MASTINTSALDVNFPAPGFNTNSSQGFRDNFSNIKNNLNAASTEITDLQNRVDNSNYVFDQANENLVLKTSLMPAEHETYDLGSTSTAWKDLYLSGTTIYLGNAVIKANENGTLNLSDNHGIAVPTGTPSYLGATGDVPGMIKVDASYVYVCVGTYDGSTSIWKRASLSSF